MRILIATEVIHPGGAETFLLRLSEALHQRGHEVVIFNFRADIYHQELKEKIAPNVTVVCADNPTGLLTKAADAIALRLKIDSSLRDKHIRSSLHKLLDSFKPDIIHSHLFKTDVICCEVAKAYNLPVISTMHGDYNMYYHNLQKGLDIRLPNFINKLHDVLQSLRCIVCISEEQLAFFRTEMQLLATQPLHLEKIYNGYTASLSHGVTVTRESLNIPGNAFVFGMVARGIPSKGWEELIEAFQRLNKSDTYLVLVGGSDYMNQLQQTWNDHERIRFAGTVTNPLEWIKVFDVGLLPSYFGSESLPTVVMEYLYCNKPVIATKIGEIPFMIQKESSTAGLLVEIINGKTDVDQLYEAMHHLYSDRVFYKALSASTNTCFQQFEMERCVQSYENIYKQYAS